MSGQVKMLVLRVVCGLVVTNAGFWLIFGRWWWAPYAAVAAVLVACGALGLVIAFFNWVFTGRFEVPVSNDGGC